MTRISISTNAQTIMSILNSGETKDYEKVRASAGLTEKEMGAEQEKLTKLSLFCG